MGGNLYQWPAPAEQEYCTEPLDRIITAMESPILVNQRQQCKLLNIGDVSELMTQKKICTVVGESLMKSYKFLVHFQT